VWLHHSLYIYIHTHTQTHARTYAHELLSDINFWPDDQERSHSKYRWLYSNKGYCCADWNKVLYCRVAVNSGALITVRNLLQYVISMPICHTHMYSSMTAINMYSSMTAINMYSSITAINMYSSMTAINMYSSITVINQPLTGRNRTGSGSCVDYWV
jgi:hypothetical protein